MFNERPKTIRTSSERWVRISPDEGGGYRLYDPLADRQLGRILFDAADNWVYDGQALDVYEQEEIAGTITGNEREMNELLNSVKGK